MGTERSEDAAVLERELAEVRRETVGLRDRFQVLSDLTLQLATELDPTALLPAVVTAARRLTASEAGSLYVRRGDRLAFAVAQNDRMEPGGAPGRLPELSLPLDGRSLAGLAAVERRTLNLPDARSHESHSADTAQRFEYEARAMLVLPLIARGGELLGVLQLMNPVDAAGASATYDEAAVWMAGVLASHGATAMSIAGLHAELREVFDAIVRYSAAAVDGRDPCTAGHSSRVAAYARMVAEELGGFSSAELRELRFAGILHDVGKIGVRERVLLKATRVDPEDMAALEARLDAAAERWIGRAWEVAGGDAEHPALVEARARAEALEQDRDFLRRVNGGGWLSAEDEARVRTLAATTSTDWRGREAPLLRPDEAERLLIQKGNLTPRERAEVQEHVSLSYRFLRQIPFPVELARVPELVWSHHERMDGAGYPRRLRGDEILPAARILAAIDVYDALTAADRPYKGAMGPERALQILVRESEQGAWDPDVVAAIGRLIHAGRIRARGPVAEVGALDEGALSREVWGRGVVV